MKITRLLVLFTLFLISCQSGIEGSSHSKEIEVKATARALMEQYHVPGISIGVFEQDSSQFYNFGKTSSKGVAINENTIFQAASLGKPLFAYSALKTYIITLDTEINHPSEIFNTEWGKKITIEHLLSHSSGLSFNDNLQRPEITFEPSSQWQYSGLNYYLLQLIVLSNTNESPDEVVYSALTNSHFTNTSYVQGSSYNNTGHDRSGRAISAQLWDKPNIGSSLYTSSKDYLEFLTRLLEETQLGSQLSKTMLKTRVEVDASKQLYWGLGWAIAKSSSDTLFIHWGSNPGFKSLAIGSLNQKKAMVILTNGDNGLEVATRLVPIIFGKNYPFLEFYMLHPDD